MNQILNNKLSKNSEKKNMSIIYIVILTISIVCLIFFVISYKFKIRNDYEKTQQISNNYKILKLYTNQETKNIKTESNIGGTIIIPKISINYAFFNTYNENLLKILPCRFYGDMPPQKSNLCITAHNYNDERFFGRISELNIGDLIIIEDNYKNSYNYYVYNKFEVIDTDLSPLKYEYINDYILTLITCNNLNNKRIIIKAKQ